MLNNLLADIGGMFGLQKVPFINDVTLYTLKNYGILLLAGIVGATPFVRNCVQKVSAKTVYAVVEPLVLAVLFLLCTAYLVDGSFNPFL